jgi:hypothetical protein
VQAFLSRLNEIKARRPKWRDFDISSSVSGWTRFPAAEQWLKKAGLSPEPDKATVQEQVPLDPKKRDALFREFAGYPRTLGPGKATFVSIQTGARRSFGVRPISETSTGDRRIPRHCCRSLIGEACPA